MAPLTAEDRILIKCLREEKVWNAMRMMQEFPLRKWKKRTLNDLISEIDKIAQQTVLRVVVVLALREYRKTFSSFRNLFAAKKDNREPAKVRGKLLVRLEYRTALFDALLRRTCTLRRFVGAKCSCCQTPTRRNDLMLADD